MEPRLARAGGIVSIWYGRPGGPPSFARLADETHPAASTIKLALLVAAYRLADAGTLDLDSTVRVRADVASVTGRRFAMDRGYDNDEEPWQRLGRPASLRWLARRMIVRSSNLATNLLLERVGRPAVTAALDACGAAGSAMRRPICDDAAEGSNVVTAADLAAVLGALATGRAASPAACAEMLEVLEAQEYLDAIPAGLPPGTPVASKGGWVDDLLHDAALVRPDGAPAYVLVVCTSGAAGAGELIPEIAAGTWAGRHSLA